MTSEQQTAAEPSNEPTAEAYIRETPPEPEAHNETFTVPRYLFNYVLIAAVALVAGILIGGLAFGGGSTIDGTTVAAIVREAIAEAGVAAAPAEGGDTTAAAGTDGAAQREQLMASLVDDDPAIGPEDAPITIVEFSDFYCPWCGRYATETFPRLVEEYDGLVRIIYRDMPIVGGPPSEQAAIAAHCAYQQDQFWEMHGLIFSNTNLRERANYIEFAQQLGLDIETFETCLDNPEVATEITLDQFDGQDLGIRGVPAFLINGRFVSGAQPFENFARIIDAELIRAGLTPPSRQ